MRKHTNLINEIESYPDDKMHPASILAICAGFAGLVVTALYLGVWVDAFIGLMEI